jgi:LacI family transcriptional regulator
VVRGFAASAHERDWTLLHYFPSADLDWLLAEVAPEAVVLGPQLTGPWPSALATRMTVCVNTDCTAEGVASVCLDEEQIADVALSHLLSKGIENLTTFRFDPSPFAVRREQRFREQCVASGARWFEPWWVEGAMPSRSQEDPAAIRAWLSGLGKPCGVFACCDAWARVVARYAALAGLRVPEDVAIVGADNDTMECEITVPALSSVAVPWRSVGQQAATLVQQALQGRTIAGKRVVIAPADIVARRSTDSFAIRDTLVAAAVTWIHSHADRPLSVPSVAGAMSTTRQRLERRFRATLGRTVMQEVRRAHVEAAKRLLSATHLALPEIAKRSGFTNPALLGIAFRREVGLPPGAYRKRLQGRIVDQAESNRG